MPPRFGELRRFCQIDGWEETTSRRKGKDHYRYRKRLDDGSILRTRASDGNDEIGDPNLWRHIWRDQLGLEGEDQFWEALRTGDPVDRSTPEDDKIPEPAGSQDASLFHALVEIVGLPESEVQGMSNDEMLARWMEHVEGQTSTGEEDR